MSLVQPRPGSPRRPTTWELTGHPRVWRMRARARIVCERMQSYRLTIDKFLDHAAKWFGDREVVEADCGRVVVRTTYPELREGSNRLSGALAALGVRMGDRVGTLAWNTRHHFEVYYAAMGMG